MKKTFVIGHKNPDTDSVTAAIALSHLKNQLGMDTEPRVLGTLNKETEFVLKYFNIDTPNFLNDVKVQVEDVPFNRELMINEKTSIHEAYTYMVKNGITGLPVVKNENIFSGYVSLKEIATDFIKGDFDYLNTSYDNIVKVLGATSILKYDEEVKGDVYAVTFSSESFIQKANLDENSIVIVGNRDEVINHSIDKKVDMLILIGGQTLNEEQLKRAQENKINVISTPKFSFEVCKIIGLANYIKNIVRNETPVVFNPKDYLSDFFEVSNKLKHTNYPILDKNNVCNGLLRLLDVNSYDKKNVILVDHNDIKQSVDGLSEATIVEIIDHHAIGNLTTNAPISFRNMIVGSTNTIIYYLYKESNIEIPEKIAGIMLSGILSDTLILKSPTTTETDKIVVEELSKIAKLDYQKYGMEMLKAGSSLDGLSIEEVVYLDYKEFQANEMGFGIGQVLTLDYEQVLNKKEEYIEFLNKTCKDKGFKLMALYVTDVVNNGSYVLYNDDAKQIMSLAYNKEDMCEGYYLDGVISRKKQMVPQIMQEFENMD